MEHGNEKSSKANAEPSLTARHYQTNELFTDTSKNSEHSPYGVAYIIDKSKVHLKAKNRLFFVLLSIVLIVALVFSISTLVTNLSKQASANSVTKISQSQTFFLLCIGDYLSYDVASIQSQQIQDAGGAGYIWKDKNFTVIVQAYTTEKDAKKVSEQLLEQGYETQTLKVVTPVISLPSNLTSDDQAILTDAYELLDKTFDKLYTLGYNLDTNQTNITLVQTELVAFKDEFYKKLARFKNAFSHSTTESIITLDTSLTTLYSELELVADPTLNKQKINPYVKHTSIFALSLRSSISEK